MRSLLLALLLAAGIARAETPAALLDAYAREAKAASPSFTAFSAERGRAFFGATHDREWSCATCHGAAPTAAGKHATTGKSITALAPAANATRFTSAAKAEKWFNRNCNDVAGRACTPQEKGDVLAWLLTLR